MSGETPVKTDPCEIPSMLADKDVVKQIAAQRSLSMTGRRRDLANLPTIRQQNSAARFRHGREAKVTSGAVFFAGSPDNVQPAVVDNHSICDAASRRCTCDRTGTVLARRRYSCP